MPEANPNKNSENLLAQGKYYYLRITCLYWLLVVEEERKGSGGARELLDATNLSEEMYDDFDGDAVQLGAVDMVAMMNSASAVG